MDEAVTCERLTNAKREGVKHYPHKCGLPAVRYRVTGTAFLAYAVLCNRCRGLAAKEGYILEVAPLL
jgi:hypothetical protein